MSFNSDWKPFDSVKSCPKCGSKAIGSRYCDGWYPCSVAHWAPDDAKHEQIEHLHKDCRNCGYTWKETTKEQEETPAMRDRRELVRPVL